MIESGRYACRYESSRLNRAHRSKRSRSEVLSITLLTLISMHECTNDQELTSHPLGELAAAGRCCCIYSRRIHGHGRHLERVTSHQKTRSSATAEKQRVSCRHRGGEALQSTPPLPSGYTYAYGRIRNPQQTYAKRAVRKEHFKLNRAFKVIQGYHYLCRQELERCIVVMSN